MGLFRRRIITEDPFPQMSRRTAVRSIAAAPFALSASGVVGGRINPVQSASTNASLGSITGNDPAGYLRFAGYFGKKPALAQLYFNQTSPAALQSSIPYICAQAKLFIANGADILWSVPFPGFNQLEAVASGAFDALYKSLFVAILQAKPGSTPILLRLPWEFNLPGQHNAAFDKTGRWNPNLFVNAWRRLAVLARAASSRFQRIWCPNVTTMGCDPFLCWVGMPYVEIISQDFYMQRAYNKPGDFSWFLKEARGLAWGVEFARLKAKPFGLTEWGMDSDLFLADFNNMVAWIKGLGSLAHHHCWWDRSEDINCTISYNTAGRTQLAAAYKTAFI